MVTVITRTNVREYIFTSERPRRNGSSRLRRRGMTCTGSCVTPSVSGIDLQGTFRGILRCYINKVELVYPRQTVIFRGIAFHYFYGAGYPRGLEERNYLTALIYQPPTARRWRIAYREPVVLL